MSSAHLAINYRSFLRRSAGAFTKHPSFLGLQLTTWLLVILVVLVPAFITTPALGEGRMPARTQVAGIDISGMELHRAEIAVQEKLDELSNQEFTVALNGTTHTFLARDIGLTYHLPVDVSEIAAYGLSGTYDISANINPAQFQSHVTRLTGQLPQPAVNASVVIEGVHARVVPGSAGTNIDSDAYRQALEAQAFSPAATILVDVSETHPTITTSDAEIAAAKVNNMLAKPVTLVAGSKRWTIPVETVAQAVMVVPGEQGGLELAWDLDPIQPQIAAIIHDIETTERADAWIQDLGHKQWLVPEQGTMMVDKQRFIEQLLTTLNRGEHKVLVPVSITPADKSTEDIMTELGITTVIAEGTSVYEGSGPGRTHNVETASYYLDRTLVAPGATYSFNRSVGSLFSGEYMSAGSYIGGPNEQSLAGGVCQVSTTVFRAALESGFPIVERWPHWYRTIYYEMGGWDPGYEAAIAQDEHAPFAGSDLRFRNPTDSWLLITSHAENGKITVQIHGSETGYRVEYTETQVSVAHPAPTTITVMVDDQLPPGTLSRQEALDGLAASFTRRVYDRNGDLIWEDTWSTTYLPMETIIRASPDMEDEAKRAARE